jgi:hypothetical protein
MRCAAKNLSAISPMMKGAMIAPQDWVPYAIPFCTSLADSDLVRYVPMVTNHPPHMKNSRNIMVDSCTLVRMGTIFGIIAIVILSDLN